MILIQLNSFLSSMQTQIERVSLSRSPPATCSWSRPACSPVWLSAAPSHRVAPEHPISGAPAPEGPRFHAPGLSAPPAHNHDFS